jgi:hypothetical protein
MLLILALLAPWDADPVVVQPTPPTAYWVPQQKPPVKFGQPFVKQPVKPQPQVRIITLGNKLVTCRRHGQTVYCF